MLTHLHVVCGCFYTRRAEVRRSGRARRAAVPKILTIWPFTENRLSLSLGDGRTGQNHAITKFTVLQ